MIFVALHATYMFNCLLQDISSQTTLHQQSYVQMEAQQQPPIYMQFNSQYPVTTAMMNGHSHAMSGSPLTTADSGSPGVQAVAVQARISAASGIPLVTSGMYGEEGGFTDLFNAAAASSEDSLLMGKRVVRLDPRLNC